MRISDTLNLSAEEISQFQGHLSDANVVGCGRGERQRAGRWTRESCLSVYVQRKFSDEELARSDASTRPLPRQVGSCAVDVLEVGALSFNVAHWSSFASAIDVGFGAAAVADPEGPPLVLLAGHAALPRPGGAYLPRWSPGDGGSVKVQGHQGVVVGGAFGDGQGVDWAVIRLPDVKVQTEHHVTKTGTPIAYTGVLRPHEPLHFFSPVRREFVHGAVLGFEASLKIAGTVYSNLLLVASTDEGPFSVRRDSGSLVFNAENRAIGMIVASSDDRPISALATIPALVADPDFARFARHFFQ